MAGRTASKKLKSRTRVRTLKSVVVWSCRSGRVCQVPEVLVRFSGELAKISVGKQPAKNKSIDVRSNASRVLRSTWQVNHRETDKNKTYWSIDWFLFVFNTLTDDLDFPKLNMFLLGRTTDWTRLNPVRAVSRPEVEVLILQYSNRIYWVYEFYGEQILLRPTFYFFL